MKPLYIFLILFALFITGFADALELAFTTIIPGVGIAIGMPLAMVINITMGAGLVFLLILNGMFHPKLGPAGIVASIIPGVDSLPIWLGLVIAGILYKMKEEEKAQGAAGLLTKVSSLAGAIPFANPARAAARQIMPSVGPKPHVLSAATQTPQREPLNVKSPRMIDVTPRTPARAANDNQPYVQKAA